MSKLGGLINGQDIAFDTHQAGDQNIRWQDLHLEKRLHKGGKIRYPMFGNRVPSKSQRVNDDTIRRVTREVQKALSKNPIITEKLAQTIAGVLQRFTNYTATLASVTEAARKISSYFDLGEPFVESVIINSNKIMTEFTSRHRMPDLNEDRLMRFSKNEVVIEKYPHARTASESTGVQWQQKIAPYDEEEDDDTQKGRDRRLEDFN